MNDHWACVPDTLSSLPSQVFLVPCTSGVSGVERIARYWSRLYIALRVPLSLWLGCIDFIVPEPA